MSEEKRILSIEEMLSAEDIEYREIPTWKVKDQKTGQMVQGYTRIVSLTAEQVAKWRETNEANKHNMGLRLFVDSLVDKDGNRIGSEAHYEAFKKKSNAFQERVVAEVIKLNGLSVKPETTKND
jgi:hypothetical protein